MSEAKLHNCENCGIDFEYENEMPYDLEVYHFKEKRVKMIVCPNCHSLFNFVHNIINDFTYLEYVGIFIPNDIDYSSTSFLFK